MFELTVNRARHRIELTIGQFLDLGLLTDSERDLRDGVAAILGDRPHFDLLVCLDGLGPASREASAKMDEMFANFLSDHLRRAAHVGFSSLGVLQMRRVTKGDPRFQFFADRAAAIAWLDS